MRYVMGRVEKEEHDMIYRIYITDSLKAISGLNVRYYDLIDNSPVETRTADEIKDHIKNKVNNLE